MIRYLALSIAFVAGLAPLAGCGLDNSSSSSSPSEPIPEMTIRIEGTVTSEATGAPIPNALVQVMTHGGSTTLCIPVRQNLGAALGAISGLGMIVTWGPSCPYSFPTYTDELGRFSISQNVRETTPRSACVNAYVLTADAPGHDAVSLEAPTLRCTEELQTVDFVLVGNGAPILASPAAGALIDQNFADLGCSNPPRWGTGLRIHFDWVGTTEPLDGPFRIRLRRPVGGHVLVDELVETSEYEFTYCDYIADDDLGGWEWSVRLEDGGEPRTWEGPRSLHFQPCRLVDGTPCRADEAFDGGTTDDGGTDDGGTTGADGSISTAPPELLLPVAGARVPQNFLSRRVSAAS